MTVKQKTSKIWILPWLMCLSELSTIPQTERGLVWFPLRAHAWVAGQVPRVGETQKATNGCSLTHQCFSLSLSPSCPFSLKINTIFKICMDFNLLWQLKYMRIGRNTKMMSLEHKTVSKLENTYLLMTLSDHRCFDIPSIVQLQWLKSQKSHTVL